MAARWYFWRQLQSSSALHFDRGKPTSSCTIDVSYLLAQQITGYIYSFAYSMMGKMYHSTATSTELSSPGRQSQICAILVCNIIPTLSAFSAYSATPKTWPYLVILHNIKWFPALLLHHHSTLLYLVHISSRLACICIIEPNKPLFLSIAAPVFPAGPSQCRKWSKTYSHFCHFDRRVFWHC